MQKIQRKIPMRTCVVTREKLPKLQLFRIVRCPDNSIIIDDDRGKSNGRGAYLKKDKEVIQKAKKSKVLNHHLETQIPDEIYDELINRL